MLSVVTTMFPLRLCGGKPSVAVTRERRYGPSRLRVNDDDDDGYVISNDERDDKDILREVYSHELIF